MTVIREAARSLLGRMGYRLQRAGTPIRSYGECLDSMRRLGLQPRTVLDVGVAEGTPDLYRAFPDARHILIEPLEEFRDRLEQLTRARDATFVIAAAGAAAGVTRLRIGRDRRKSSMARQVLKSDVAETREVSVVTLDDVCRDHGGRPPYLVKADVEGAELEVMAGARQILSETDVVILEVTVWDESNDLPELFDTVRHMKQEGFVVHDLIGAATHEVTGSLTHVDLVFVREHGRFRHA